MSGIPTFMRMATMRGCHGILLARLPAGPNCAVARRFYRNDMISGVARNRISFAEKCAHGLVFGGAVMFWYVWGMTGIPRWRPPPS